ncbi:hypothetical protein V2J09_011120 [Rumex salicifolius]
MAVQLIREWAGINQFPAATQARLLELLGKLKQENVHTLTILVMGKGGVGKSSTVNSIVGERVVAVSAFQSEAPRPVMVSRSRAGFTLNIIDTPGLIEEGYVNSRAIDMIKRFLLNKTIDVLLYLDRLDAYRVDNLDRQIIKVITESFGKGIWQRAAIVLTHAQLSPPDALTYQEYFSKRSEAILKVVNEAAGIKNREPIVSHISMIELSNPCLNLHLVGLCSGRGIVFNIESVIPVVLVENTGRCNKNENDEKVLPNGVVWISNLVGTIIDIVSNGSKAVLVDQKLIDGPNANARFKKWIPLILAFEYLFVIKGIQRAIKSDVAAEFKPMWEVAGPDYLHLLKRTKKRTLPCYLDRKRTVDFVEEF